MFHNEMMRSEEEGQQFNCLYDELADAIHAPLRMLMCVMAEWRKKSLETKDDIHLTSLLLIFDCAEAIDGVSILVRAGSARNGPPLLRTALEVQLGLMYLLETTEGYRPRSLAYEYFTVLDRLRWAQRCDPDNDIGIQLRAETVGHMLADIFDVKDRDVKESIRFYEERANSARYVDIRSEMDRMKGLKRKPDNWFSLWDGPASVRALAYHFKEGPQYEIFYRTWSKTTHGAGALNRITAKESGMADADPLRSPKGIVDVARNAFNACNVVSMLLVDKLVPHLRNDVRSHYVAQVSPKLAVIERAKELCRKWV